MMKGEFYVVEYLGWETTYTEIVQADRLRPKSEEPCITSRTFMKFKIPLRDEIRDFYSQTPEDKHHDLHKDFCNVRLLFSFLLFIVKTYIWQAVNTF